MRSLVHELDLACWEDFPARLLNLRKHITYCDLPSWTNDGFEKYFSTVTKCYNLIQPPAGPLPGRQRKFYVSMLRKLSACGLTVWPREAKWFFRSWEYTWDRILQDSRNAKISLNVLFGLILARSSGFRSLDQTSHSWTHTWQLFMKKYAILHFLGLATKWMKYHLAAFFSKAARQELPSPLDGEVPGMFLSGIGYCCLRHLAFSGDLGAAFSILMAKKGLPPVRHFELLDSVDDCVKLLTGPPQKVRLVKTFNSFFDYNPARLAFFSSTKREAEFGAETESIVDPDLFEDELSTPVVVFEEFNLCSSIPKTMEGYLALPYKERLKVLIHQVRRSCREVYSHVKWPVNQPIPLPSVSSHSESTKSTGGAYGFLSSLLLEYRNEHPLVPTESYYTVLEVDRHPDEKDLLGWLSSNGYLSSSILTEWRYGVKGGVMYGDHNERIMNRNCSWSNRCVTWFEFITRVALSEPNVVVPVGLPEPLKVRIITRGPSLRYYVGKLIQKLTHGVLRSHPAFRAIGEPLTEDYLSSRLGVLGSGESYLSGDYKAATDLIHPDLSAVAAYEIGVMMGLSPTGLRIFVDGLVNSSILYRGHPNEFGVTSDKLTHKDYRKQTWGQLMGSPLSFPILCLVNGAINRYFLELVGPVDSLTLEDSPMCINGDDILMRVPTSSYGDWGKLVSDGGLVPSLGKNYLSRKFAIMNSTLYHYGGPQLVSPWTPIFNKCAYFNLALITPQYNTEPGLDPVQALLDLSRISNDAVKGFDGADSDRIMSQFMGWSLTDSLLKRVPAGVSFFADPKLGGLGLARTRGGVLTEEQLGYYTRLAGSFGSLSTLPGHLDKGGRAEFSLYDTIPRFPLWDDWLLDRLDDNLHAGHYFEAYERDPRPCEVNSSIARKSKPNFRIHDDVPFKRHQSPWPEHNLCSFPWYRAVVAGRQDLDIPCVSICNRVKAHVVDEVATSSGFDGLLGSGSVTTQLDPLRLLGPQPVMFRIGFDPNFIRANTTGV